MGERLKRVFRVSSAGYRSRNTIGTVLLSAFFWQGANAGLEVQSELVFEPGHPTLKSFLLPDQPVAPSHNLTTPARVELGKTLFFDPRLSANGNMSCATCHNPSLGWSDGLPTGRGHNGRELDRATPTVINTAFNSIQMWDGRAPSLEAQALGPLEAKVEMAADFDAVFELLTQTQGYVDAFEAAYPGEEISKETIGKAIAAFERTVVSNNSPFDQWIRGDAQAMNAQQVRGFSLFMNPAKGNCAECHSGANFTDNSFHNLGLQSSLGPDADLGRFNEKPIGILRSAFKTPTLRDIDLTAPYFHDGSANTLKEVMVHYVNGPVDGASASPAFKPSNLTDAEQDDIVAFMQALTGETSLVSLPVLPY